MMSAAERPASIVAELEQLRLEHRAARLEAVLRELRARARNHPAPRLLATAIGGFDAELIDVRRRLGANASAGAGRRRRQQSVGT